MKTRTCLILGVALLALTGTALAQQPAEKPMTSQAADKPFTGQETDITWLPYGASDYTEDVDFLYRAIFWVVTAMLVLTEGLLVTFCIIYRRRPGHRPTYTHGSNKAEITWTVVPALMLLGLAIWQIPTWNHIKKPDWKAIAAEANLTAIDVMGQQFKWYFRYPGTKKEFKGEQDLTTVSTIHMPFGNKALLNLRSKDVIHSVFIPHMRVKQDAVPGMRQRIWFKPAKFFLVDLKGPKIKDGGRGADGKRYDIQSRIWVTDEKDFGPGGRFFDKRVAVSAGENYTEKDGIYDVYRPPGGGAHKVRVVYQGQVIKGLEWETCDYAVGIFEIACAELCGLGHYTMRGFLIVEPRASYNYWIKTESEDAGDLDPVWKFWKD